MVLLTEPTRQGQLLWTQQSRHDLVGAGVAGAAGQSPRPRPGQDREIRGLEALRSSTPKKRTLRASWGAVFTLPHLIAPHRSPQFPKNRKLSGLKVKLAAAVTAGREALDGTLDSGNAPEEPQSLPLQADSGLEQTYGNLRDLVERRPHRIHNRIHRPWVKLRLQVFHLAPQILASGVKLSVFAICPLLPAGRFPDLDHGTGHTRKFCIVRKLQNPSQNRKIRFEMGTVITTIEVGDLQGRNSRRVEVEVDTGSTYTALPRELLQALGVQVRRTVTSRLADGSEKPVQVGYANVRLAGAELITPVIFAEEGEPSLLGVITLEDALLAVDPVNNELIPVAAKRY